MSAGPIQRGGASAPRSVRESLPTVEELRPARAADERTAEELRLLATAPSRAPRGAAIGPIAALPPPDPRALVALEAAAGRLADAARAPALAKLDAASRAAIEPRLAAVQEMARAIRELASMQRAVSAKLRSGGSV